MRAEQRRANRDARKRIRARNEAVRAAVTVADMVGITLLPWQLEFIASGVAGPDPRSSRIKNQRIAYELLSNLFKDITE